MIYILLYQLKILVINEVIHKLYKHTLYKNIFEVKQVPVCFLSHKIGHLTSTTPQRSTLQNTTMFFLRLLVIYAQQKDPPLYT